MSAGATRTNPLCEALKHYLARHPDAADSPEGIRQWWLPEELRATPLELIRQAMQDLVASGDMRCSTLPDGTELYAHAADSEGNREKDTHDAAAGDDAVATSPGHRQAK